MKIITLNMVKVEGDYVPPGTELDLPEEEAVGLVADGAAEILELATEPEGSSEEDNAPDNDNPTNNDDAGEPGPEEPGGEPVIVQVVRKVLEQAESDPDLVTKEGRPKVGAVEELLNRKSSVEEIQEALEAIQAEERG